MKRNDPIRPNGARSILGQRLQKKVEKASRVTSPKTKPSWKEQLVILMTVLVASINLFVAYRLTNENVPSFQNAINGLQKALVLEVLDSQKSESQQVYDSGEAKGRFEYMLRFKAELLEGEERGQRVEVIQNVLSIRGETPRLVQAGNKVYIADQARLQAQSQAEHEARGGVMPSKPSQIGESKWVMHQFDRIEVLYYAIGLFFLILLVLGKWKGLGTLLALVYTISAIFFVYIPGLLSGFPIYLLTAWLLLSIIAVTVLLINGANQKSLTAAIGTIFGMAFAALFLMGLQALLQLTGIINEQSSYLLLLNKDNPIDLKALAFSSVLIGATGALLDVGVDLAASLYEYSQTTEGRRFGTVFKTGIEIGRDIIGTMVNTLILAYVGASITSLLMLAAFNKGNLLYLLNSEDILIELLQMLIGSFGVLICVPLTSLVCAFFFTRKKALHPV